MLKTTRTDREKELRNLLDTLEAHPERALPEARARVAVLQKMLGAQEKVAA